MNQGLAQRVVESHLGGPVEVIDFKDGEVRSMIQVRHEGELKSFVVDHLTGTVEPN